MDDIRDDSSVLRVILSGLEEGQNCRKSFGVFYVLDKDKQYTGIYVINLCVRTFQNRCVRVCRSGSVHIQMAAFH